MNIQMRYYTDSIPWLCFKHAVQRATQGEGIHTDIVDKDQYELIREYDTLEQTTCPYCIDECNESFVTKEDNDDH